MKKIISTTLVFGIFLLTSFLFGQEMSKEQRKAFQTDNIDVFKAAFSKADYNKCFGIKEESYTLLSFSVKHDRKNIFNYLLANNADVNKACNNQTPLMIAGMYGNANMAKTLLKKGADKNAKNGNGETAKDFSVKYKQAALTAILK